MTIRTIAASALTLALVTASPCALAQSAVQPATRPATPPRPAPKPLANPVQAEPYATKSVVNHPRTIGWPKGRTPIAPRGYKVLKFADGLDYPRQVLLLGNGDVLVAEARTLPKLDADPEVARGQALSKATGFSANRITLLRDTNRDGVADQRFVLRDGLNQPFGMQYVNGQLYVANTDGVVAFPFQPGQTRITAAPRTIATLPAGGYNNHWTRNLLVSPDMRTLYVSVGSASNVGEFGMDEEKRRAAILAIDLSTGRERIYASGLRNPVGMDFAPTTGTLWTAVNERDHLGDDISPDYLAGVREGGFYGWPYSYYGKQDPRHANTKRALLATTLMPDVAVGAHAAALGIAFAKDRPANRQVAYVARHGSWNRSSFLGYDVLAVPFANGRPTGEPQAFLTGFTANPRTGDVYGRPVSVQTRPDGAVFVVDDAGDTVWLVQRTS